LERVFLLIGARPVAATAKGDLPAIVAVPAAIAARVQASTFSETMREFSDAGTDQPPIIPSVRIQMTIWASANMTDMS
jgi:hypothetical protein